MVVIVEVTVFFSVVVVFKVTIVTRRATNGMVKILNVAFRDDAGFGPQPILQANNDSVVAAA